MLGLPLRTGNISRSGPTGLYSAIGGDISITVTSDDQWRRMCNALETPGTADRSQVRDLRETHRKR